MGNTQAGTKPGDATAAPAKASAAGGATTGKGVEASRAVGEVESDVATSMTPEQTRTEVWKYVSPADAYSETGELQLGTLLQYIDAATCMSAEKLAGTYSVTASADDMVFSDAVCVGEAVCIKSQVNRSWNSSMEVGCRVERHVPGVACKKICSAFFTFVVQKRAVAGGKLKPIVPQSATDERRYAEAAERRSIRLARKTIVASAIVARKSTVDEPAGSRASQNSIRGRGSMVEAFEEDTRRLTQLSAALGFSEGSRDSVSKKKSGVLSKLRKGSRKSISMADAASVGTDATLELKSKSSADSAIVTAELVLPPHGNHNGTTFGGQIMYWMAQAAYLCAMRHCERMVRIRSVDDVHFMAPSNVGDNIVISAVGTRVFATFLEVEVTAKAAKFGQDGAHINTCYMTFVAPNSSENSQTTKDGVILPDLVPQTPDEIRRHMEALGRRRLALERHALGRSPVLSIRWSPELRETIVYSNVSALLRIAAAGDDGSWTVLSDQGGVKLTVKKSSAEADFLAEMSGDPENAANSVVIVMIQGIVDAPAKEVYDVVRNLDKRKVWDPYLQSASVVSEVSEEDDIVHTVFNAAGGTRDFCLLRSWRAMDSSAYVMASRSVLHPSVPETEGISRGEVLSSGFVVRPTGDPQKSLVIQIVQTSGSTLTMGAPELLGHSKGYMETFKGIYRCVNPTAAAEHAELTRTRSNSRASAPSPPPRATEQSI